MPFRASVHDSSSEILTKTDANLFELMKDSEKSPEKANEQAAQISQKIGKKVITIYGGSVNPENAATLFGQENIEGGLLDIGIGRLPRRRSGDDLRGHGTAAAADR
jgi:hypothetical protein